MDKKDAFMTAIHTLTDFWVAEIPQSHFVSRDVLESVARREHKQG
jgi:hypothetical protein